MNNPNFVVWFEIPAADFERAVRFYEAVFQISMKRESFGDEGMWMAFFAYQPPSVGGAVVCGEPYKPGAGAGTIVYLNGGEDLAGPLSRVEAAGGTVLVPKTLITPEIGYYAHFLDTEGNRVALHSMS